jgi:hypothetical protein
MVVETQHRAHLRLSKVECVVDRDVEPVEDAGQE